MEKMSFEDLTKSYYQIGEVAELLGIPASTLRFWESKFTIVKPRRGASGRRFYTPDDIDKIAQIHYLVKEKGMKLDAAQDSLRTNPDGIETRFRVLMRLKRVRAELAEMLDALNRKR